MSDALAAIFAAVADVEQATINEPEDTELGKAVAGLSVAAANLEIHLDEKGN